MYNPSNFPTSVTPPPPSGLQRVNTRLRSLSRIQQIGAGCLALLVVCIACAACGGILQAIGAAGGASSTGQQHSQQQQTGQQATHAPKATNTPAQPTATPKPKVWTTIADGHFEGNSNFTSPTIHLKDGMRIVWSFTPTDPAANLCIMNLNDTTTQLTVASLCDDANAPQGKSGTYNVHGDADVYLDIQADSVTYSIDVQQLR